MNTEGKLSGNSLVHTLAASHYTQGCQCGTHKPYSCRDRRGHYSAGIVSAPLYPFLTYYACADLGTGIMQNRLDDLRRRSGRIKHYR